MNERPPGGTGETTKKLEWAGSPQLSNRFFSEWSMSRYEPEQSEFRLVLESLFGSIYERELEPDRPKWDARDREIRAVTEWVDHRFCIEDADAKGQWELTSNVSVDADTGKISVNILCKHLADQHDQSAKPTQERAFLVELQAAPEIVAREKTLMREAIEKKREQDAAQQAFDTFAAKNLNRKMTGDEAEKLLNDKAALAWGFIPDKNTFEIKDDGDHWSIIIDDADGLILDIIGRPKYRAGK
jgi:hypothetical protein